MLQDSGLASWLTMAEVVGKGIALYVALVWAATAYWALRDIRRRSNDPFVQAAATALVTLAFLPGLWLYLILRPRVTLEERYERQLEAEAVLSELAERQSCPTCVRPVKDDYLVCPACRTRLKEPCDACGRALNRAWLACPGCGAATAAPAHRPAVAAHRPAAAAAAASATTVAVREPLIPASATEPLTRPSVPQFRPAAAAFGRATRSQRAGGSGGAVEGMQSASVATGQRA